MMVEASGSGEWPPPAGVRLLEHLPDAVYLIDPQTSTILWGNRRAWDMLGRLPHEVLGHSVLSLQMDEAGPPHWDDMAAAIRATDCFTAVGRYRHAAGHGVEVEVNTTHFTEDGRAYFLSVARDMTRRQAASRDQVPDITRLRQTEAELQRHRDNLEALVEERTVALSIAKELADSANRAKGQFLANLSHELRTPMNAIMGMTAIVLRRVQDPRLREQIGKIDRASRHLLAVINDVLDICKIEAERLTLDAVAFTFGDVVANCSALMRDRIADKGLQWHVETPPELASLPLVGDPSRLGQILLNFTGNALRFTEQGSITVRLTLLEERTDDVMLRCDVADTGMGIAEQDLPRMFTAFEQADGSMTRKHGGTGLGLAISKRLAALMGGAVGVESQPGQGSCFWFTFRLAKAAGLQPGAVEPVAEAASLEVQIASQFRGVRVLLAEDEPVNQEVSVGLLGYAGLRVDVAGDGAQAVDMASRNRYALILMDMQMPRLNGIDATRAIRSLPGGDDVPIIAMTANVFDEDRDRCMAAGMDDHIGKPVDADVLYATLHRWLTQPGR